MSVRRGLVLAGGGAKGAFQAGMLIAIHKLGLDIHSISGASVGALNGAMYSAGRIKDLRDMWMTMSSRKVLRPRVWAVLAPLLSVAQGYQAYRSERLDAEFPVRIRRCFWTIDALAHCAWWSLVAMLFIGDAGRSSTTVVVVTILIVSCLGLVLIAKTSRPTRVTSEGSRASCTLIIAGTAATIVMRAISREDGASNTVVYYCMLGLLSLIIVDCSLYVVGKLTSELRLSAASQQYLASTVTAALTGAILRIPLYVTTAHHPGDVFDPDNPEWEAETGFKGKIIGWTPLPIRGYIPNYTRIDQLESSEATSLLLASAALPLGIFPAVETVRGYAIDGGAADNCPVFPLVAEDNLDVMLVLNLECPAGQAAQKTHIESWRRIDRLLRVAKLSFRPAHMGLGEIPHFRIREPHAMVPLRDPPHWPRVLELAPRQTLGSFVTGTMRFNKKYCIAMLRLGYSQALEQLGTEEPTLSSQCAALARLDPCTDDVL